MRYFWTTAFVIFCMTFQVRANEISCEDYESGFGGRICVSRNYTVIDADNYTMTDATDENVRAIRFDDNKGVEFLPVGMSKKFPGMWRLWAYRCSIKEIFRKNFVGLTELERLELGNNLIEMIRSDTFQDLVKVKRIVLSGNKIKRLNSKLFEVLPRLFRVELDNNDCISEYFQSFNDVDRLLEHVSQQCGFSENDGKEFDCEVVRRSTDYHQSCSLINYTSIDAPDYSFAGARKVTVHEIDFSENKKIKFLPIGVSAKFPSIRGYKAHNCSIQQVGKKNFDRLYDLRTINLGRNQIPAIKSDTFEGLLKLAQVYLHYNGIMSMSGRLFENLPLLNLVETTGNPCMSERFDGPAEIKRLSKEVTQRCAFTDTNEVAFEKLFDLRCGTVPYATGYIIGGSEAKRGQWPFMVALIHQPTNKFFCGGTLITNRHVLSAAHCFQEKFVSRNLEANDVQVLLGRNNLKESLELGTETRSLEAISLHPDWRRDNEKYDADLAVLTMDAIVDFNNFIQPVCLTADLDIFNYEDGYVIGWGHDGGNTAHQDKLKQVLVRSVNDSTCFSRDHNLGSIYSPRHFCASGEDAGPCSGDSGGGFFVKFRGLWTLRGTVSAGAFKSDGGCDVARFTLYSKLNEYATWIVKVVEDTLSPSTATPPSVRSTSVRSTSQATRKYLPRNEFF